MEGFVLASSLVIGVLIHAFFLNRGEHHMQAILYMKLASAAFVALSLLLWRLEMPFNEATFSSASCLSLLLIGSAASMLVDRAVVGPLNKFPGPFAARLSSLYLTNTTSKKPAFRTLTELHEKHGDFVRIGSSDISVVHPDAVEKIFGAQSLCTKGSWYDTTHPMESIHNRRDPKTHNHLRRIWSPAFSDKALRGYELRIRSVRNKLLAAIDDFHGQPTDMGKWIGLYSFDVMAEMTFGKSFGMLDNKEQHWAVKTIHVGLGIHSLHLPVWVFRVMTAIPGAAGPFKKMQEYSKKLVLERRANPPDVQDIMSYLFAPYEGKKDLDEREINYLNGEANLLIVAGSDTSALTLTSALMFLAEHPEHAQKLRAELEPHVPKSVNDEILHPQIANLPHLNGIIWETLRFHPAVPSYPARLTPPEGITIGETYIPGNTTVINPAWLMGRREDFYERAQDFVPERWYEKKEMVRNKTAWAPFSAGPYNCIGKPLALMNIRLTLARLVMRYDISFAPSSTPNNRKSYEAGLKETFTMSPPELNLCLKPRA